MRARLTPFDSQRLRFGHGALLCLAFVASCDARCGGAGAPVRDGGARTSASTVAFGDGGEPSRLRLPVSVVDGNTSELALGWMFLPDDPVPTGSLARVHFGAMLPCGAEPTLGASELVGDGVLRVRVRLRTRTTAGRDAGALLPCDPRPFADYVPLQRVRLGEVRVLALGASDEARELEVRQRVVAEAAAPPPLVRRVRSCAPGDDASCGAAGGVCGALAPQGEALLGVCVPPLDLQLANGLECPREFVEARLAHEGAFRVQPAPAEGAPLRACLPRCDAGHLCAPGQRCVSIEGIGAEAPPTRVCVPDAPARPAEPARVDPPRPSARPAAFVRRVGTRLCEEDRVFRALGVNAFSLQEDEARAARGDAQSEARARGIVDAARTVGARVLRVAAFNDGARDEVALRPTESTLSEAGVAGLDRAIAHAAQAGLRVVLVLSNFWDDYGGLRQYARWARVDGRDRLRARVLCSARVASVVASHGARLASRVNPHTGLRYRDDPAILGWEVMNEPRGTHRGVRAVGCVERFVRAVAQAMRRAAPRQLLLVGDEGYDDDARGYDREAWSRDAPHARMPGPGRAQSFRALLALPSIDAGTVHWYPRAWGVTAGHEGEAGVRWIAEHAAIARALGKPLLVEEFGLPRESRTAEGSHATTAFAALDPRTTPYERWLTAVFAQPEVALAAPWGLEPMTHEPMRHRALDAHHFDAADSVGRLLARHARALEVRQEPCPLGAG